VLHRAQAQGWGQDGFPVAARILEAMAGGGLSGCRPSTSLINGKNIGKTDLAAFAALFRARKSLLLRQI